MIELVTAHDWVDSPELREEIFKFRHRVFVENLCWEIPSYDSLEFDQYDALLPIYMVARDRSGNLLALWRLLPTTGPYMLRNTFSCLLGDRKAPRAENVWEISRFAFDPKSLGVKGICDFSQVAGQLFCALGEFGLENGIDEVVAVFDKRITPILRGLACPPKWAGKPQNMGKAIAVAAGFEVSREVLYRIRKKIARPDPILTPYKETRRAA